MFGKKSENKPQFLYRDSFLPSVYRCSLPRCGVYPSLLRRATLARCPCCCQRNLAVFKGIEDMRGSNIKPYDPIFTQFSHSIHLLFTLELYDYTSNW